MSKTTKPAWSVQGSHVVRRWSFGPRVAIWLLFVAFFFGALALSGTSLSGSPVGSSHVAVLSASGSNPVITTPSTCSDAGAPCTVNPASPSSPMKCNAGASANQTCYAQYSSNPTSLLPAWRWGGATGLYQNLGVGDIFPTGIFDFMGSLFFTIAGWLWFALLALINWALTLNIVAHAAGIINSGFRSLATAVVGNFILVAVVLVVAALVLVRLILRGAIPKIVSTILVVIIPLSTLWALTAAVTNSPAGSVAKGSPGWVAVQGSHYVDIVAGELTTGFGTWSGGSSSSALGVSNGQSPNCASYLAALYDQYYAYANGVKVASGVGNVNQSAWDQANSTVSSQMNAASVSGVVAVSRLWESGFLVSWIDAQYGSLDQGQNMYCHQLEANAHISANEQKDLLVISGRYDGHNYSGLSLTLFTPISIQSNGAKEDFESQMMGWNVCHVDSSNAPVAEPNWASVALNTITTDSNCRSYFSQTPSAAVTADVADGAAVVAWAAANTQQTNDSLVNQAWSWVTNTVKNAVTGGSSGCPGAPNGGLDSSGFMKAYQFNAGSVTSLSGGGANWGCAYSAAIQGLGGGNANVGPDAPGATAQGLGTVNSTVTAMWGNNPTQRFLDGLIALITALVYVYALGALAIGSIIAQFGLVMLLSLLPITLLLLALPTKEGSRNATGLKLLKMTFAFFASKLTLIVVLLLLIQSIGIFQSLATGLVTGGYASIVYAIIPLACLFLVRKLLAAVGAANLTSMGGALAMPLAGAMIAGEGTAIGRRLQKAASHRMSQNHLAKRINGQHGRHKKQIGKGGAPNEQRKGLLGRFRNPNSGNLNQAQMAKRYLFGAKNEQGQKTELGLSHRLTSMAGLLDLSKNTKMTKAFLGTSAGQRLADGAWYRDSIRPSGSVKVADLQMQERQIMLKAAGTSIGSVRRDRVAGALTSSEMDAVRNANKEFYDDKVTSLLDFHAGVRDGRGELVKLTDGRTVYGYNLPERKAHTGPAGAETRTGAAAPQAPKPATQATSRLEDVVRQMDTRGTVSASGLWTPGEGGSAGPEVRRLLEARGKFGQ